MRAPRFLVLAGLGLVALTGAAGSQTPAVSSGPPATRAPAITAQRANELKLTAEAENARRMTDERLKRRDNAARRAMQGICKGC